MKRSFALITNGFRSRNRWRFGAEQVSWYDLVIGRAPHNVPGGFWRSMGVLRTLLRLTSVFVLLLALVNLLALIMRAARGVDSIESPLLSGLVLSVVLHGCVVSYGLRIASGRFRRYLIEHSWLVCFRCGYALTGLPPRHRCPECNLPYDSGGLREAWKGWAKRQIAYSYAEGDAEDDEEESGRIGSSAGEETVSNNAGRGGSDSP